MEPIEINAGNWYLRALRADDRIDDRPALAILGVEDPGYVADRAAGWESDSEYSWAVCEPTTAELVAEVFLTPDTGEIRARRRSDYPGAGDAEKAALEAVRRFSDAML